MADLLNFIIIEGRLTRDPEQLFTKSGVSMCTFDIAVSRKYRDKNNEQKEEVNYLSIITWNKLADTCAQYLTKGIKIRVKGSLKQETWTNKLGEKRSKVKIVAYTIDFLSFPKDKTEKEKEAALVF